MVTTETEFTGELEILVILGRGQIGIGGHFLITATCGDHAINDGPILHVFGFNRFPSLEGFAIPE